MTQEARVVVREDAAQVVRSSRARGAYAVIALVVLALVAWQVVVSVSLGSDLSRLADQYSEADALRSADGYIQQGFLANKGLPDIAFGERFAQTGSKPGAPPGEAMVYTHYPPAPNWIAGLMGRVFGLDNIAALRMAPIAVGALCLAGLALLAVRALGPWRAALLMLGLALAPAFTNMMHGLHYQGYAMSLLALELGVLAVLFRPGAAAGAWLWVGLGLLGFFQGWLSFDHCFLVTFAPLPLLALRWRDPGTVRRTLLAILCLGGAFTLAHALHFLQVVAYHGGLAAAIADFQATAVHRLNAPAVAASGRAPLYLVYLTYLVHKWEFFGWFFTLGLVGALFAVVTRRGELRFAEPASVRLRWECQPRRDMAALLLAGAVSSAWVLLMFNHAAHHGHFLPRHFFLAYFFFLFVPLDRSVAARDR